MPGSPLSWDWHCVGRLCLGGGLCHIDLAVLSLLWSSCSAKLGIFGWPKSFEGYQVLQQFLLASRCRQFTFLGRDRQVCSKEPTRDACIIQADSEEGHPTNPKTRPTGQESLGHGERDSPHWSCSKNGDCLRWYAEDKVRVNIGGNFGIFPWVFKHACFLIKRFRVLDGTNKPH